MKSNHKHYELYFILNPMLNEEKVEECISKFASFLQSKEGELDHIIKYGIKKLAYAIDGKATGFCQVIEFRIAPEHIKALEIELQRDERVMRFLTTALDNHGVDYNANKRTKVVEKIA
jgi:small subunit ribosomal protein S6